MFNSHIYQKLISALLRADAISWNSLKKKNYCKNVVHVTFLIYIYIYTYTYLNQASYLWLMSLFKNKLLCLSKACLIIEFKLRFKINLFTNVDNLFLGCSSRLGLFHSHPEVEIKQCVAATWVLLTPHTLPVHTQNPHIIRTFNHHFILSSTSTSSFPAFSSITSYPPWLCRHHKSHQTPKGKYVGFLLHFIHFLFDLFSIFYLVYLPTNYTAKCLTN